MPISKQQTPYLCVAPTLVAAALFRVIRCSSLRPVDLYAERSLLSTPSTEDAPHVARKLRHLKEELPSEDVARKDVDALTRSDGGDHGIASANEDETEMMQYLEEENWEASEDQVPVEGVLNHHGVADWASVDGNELTEEDLQGIQEQQHDDDLTPGTAVGWNDGVAGAKKADHGDDIAGFFAEAAERPFIKDLVRGNLCAFIAAREDDVQQWEVTVMSILQFVPGVRVAIAAEGNDGVAAFERCVCGV